MLSVDPIQTTQQFDAMARNRKSITVANPGGGGSARPNKKKGGKQGSSGGNAPSAVSTRGINAGPTISGGPRGQTRFSHTEFVGDITSGQTSSTDSTFFTFIINPGSIDTFPWLSRIANGYEMYRFKRLRAIYTPSCGSSTGGIVVGGFEYDGTDPAPVTKQQISALDRSARSNVWQKFTVDLDVGSGWYYVNALPFLPTNPGDVRLTDVARLFVGVFGAQPGQVVGEVSISYDIEFAKPEMGTPAPSSLITFPGSTFSKLVGTSPVVTGDQILLPVTSGQQPGNAKFKAMRSGSYIMTLLDTNVTTNGTLPTRNPIGGVELKRGGYLIDNVVKFIDCMSDWNNNVGTVFNNLQTFSLNMYAGDEITFYGALTVVNMIYNSIRLAAYKQ